jgi:formylglycine-generating enzyme required for sulfatase activity
MLALMALGGAAGRAGAQDPALAIEWVTVGAPGNACDPTAPGRCFGAVGYLYRIARHEVTNAQYAAFLNAKAASDPLALYNPDMATWSGITRGGSPGSYTYAVVPGRENIPVVNVSFFDALRFANWLHNGQGNGDTETGAYTLLGGTPTPTDTMVQRNAGATVFLATDDEWYKAAYYDTARGVYYDYPAGTDTQIVCAAPSATPNTANCGIGAGGFARVGSYTGSPSPNGTFDQGANASEWTDGEAGILDHRTIRGGNIGNPPERLRGAVREYDDPAFEFGAMGFRVASVAEGAGGSDCGNFVCESTENALNCSTDCPQNCGDAVCTGGENAVTCPTDCPQTCGDGLCTGWENPSSCPMDCPAVCGDGRVQGAEQCEAGVPLSQSCTSLGFDAGTLRCTTATCRYDTSGCFDISCKPKRATCSKDNECCSGNCFLRRCR